MLVADREAVLAIVRDLSHEGLVGQHAEAVEVAPPVDALGAGLLGTHVMGSPDGHAGARQLGAAPRLGDAEVGDHALPELIEHDVVGLDIAVDDAPLVGVSQRAPHVAEQLPDLSRLKLLPLGKHPRQRTAAQQLHHEIDDAAALSDAIDLDDVGVLETGGSPGFAGESLDEFGVKGERKWQDLDRNLAFEVSVAGPIDDRHPAAPEFLEELVLLAQGVPDDIEFGDISAGDRLDGRAHPQVEATGGAELRRLLDLGAAPLTEHGRTYADRPRRVKSLG